MSYTKEDILRIAKEENVRFIRLQFTDLLGTIKKRGNSGQPVGKSARQQDDV